jgi:hypothetical protein
VEFLGLTPDLETMFEMLATVPYILNLKLSGSMSDFEIIVFDVLLLITTLLSEV